MRCRACDKALTDKEATRKFDNWEEIPNPEDRYPDLCDHCIQDTGILAPDIDYDYTEEIIVNEEYHE